MITRSILTILLSIADSIGAADTPSCCRKELAPAAPLPDQSIYQVSSVWTNDAGSRITLASLRGRPVVLTMFFARCEFACPLLVNDMKRIEEALAANVRTNVTFALVSFDSERDTPAALAVYRKRFQLPSNWTLLTGTRDDVQELAALLGVKFKKDARGQFAHSNLITLFDADGEVMLQQSGLNQPGSDIISKLSTKTTTRN
jgi:protein SCO1